MESENLIQYLIYAHATLGGIALLAGLLALVVTKGSFLHKKAGIVFFYSMLLSTLLALVISLLPGHERPFLFAIGVFSLYLIVSGYRALRFRKENVSFQVDRLIAYLMILVGIGMIAYPLLINGSLNIVLTVFGAVGLLSAMQDLQYFRQADLWRKNWLRMHLGKMIGGYIASVTAFLVVTNLFNTPYVWFIPTVIGTLYIVYWNRKLKGTG